MSTTPHATPPLATDSDGSAHQGFRQLPAQVLHRAMAACGATNGSLFLLDGDKVAYRILAHPGSFPEVKSLKVWRALHEGLAGWALRQRQGALSADARSDERWIDMGDFGDDTGSAIAMPVSCCGRINAVVTLHHEQAHRFDEAHLAAVAEVARQVGGTVEACLLGLRMEQVRRDLDALAGELTQPSVVVTGDGSLLTANAAARRAFAISEDLARIGDPGLLAPLLDDLLSERVDDTPSEIDVRDGRFQVHRVTLGDGEIRLFFLPLSAGGPD